MLKLYYAPNACSLAPHIALTEAGAGFEAVRVDTKSGEQRSEAYLAINPKGRVPALVTDRGTLTEVAVILGWVAQTYPAAHLTPAPLNQEGDFFPFSKMQEFNIYLGSTVHVTFAHYSRAERWADSAAAIAELRGKVPASLGVVLAPVERQLADGRPWVMGEQYTVADPYLYVMERWLEREGSGGSARFPGMAAHRVRCQARPAVQKVLAVEGVQPL
jgi:glutathione S-transferase